MLITSSRLYLKDASHRAIATVRIPRRAGRPPFNVALKLDNLQVLEERALLNRFIYSGTIPFWGMVQGIVEYMPSPLGRDILLEQHLEINIVQGYLYLRLLFFVLAFL